MRIWMAILAVACLLSTWNVTAAAVSDKYLVTWLNQRVPKLEARFAYRPLDRIGWARDLRHALKLAREHDRAAFLFTFDGIEMDTGRC